MDKQGFLRELMTSLDGEISIEKINENIKYYDEYFMNEIRNGKTESEIIDMLGDPRLIAKTVIDTSEVYEEKNKVKNEDEPVKNQFKVKPGMILFIIFFIILIIFLAVIKIIRLALPILPIILLVFLIYTMFKKDR